ncbi:MAG: hypothetical protein NT121_11485, partial [Chloroflexi bacterium]|nr:hypothetical protein [Chloroflexota bacterium]
MSNQLSDIEKRIQDLIEVHLVKYLPVPSTQELITQQLAEILRANFPTQNPEDAPRIIPDHYLLVVHPAKMAQWQSDSRLMDELTEVFKLVADESGIKFTNAPSIELTADPSMPFDEIDIRASSEETIAETQNLTQSSSDEIPKRAAFLIVG